MIQCLLKRSSFLLPRPLKACPWCPMGYSTQLRSFSRPFAEFSRASAPVSAVATRRYLSGYSRRLHPYSTPAKASWNPGNSRECPRRSYHDSADTRDLPKHSYFRDTSVHIRDIERVLSDPQLAAKILAKLSGDLLVADTRATILLVTSAAAWASSSQGQHAYDFLLGAWRVVFYEQRNAARLGDLRDALRAYDTRLVHMMLNRGDVASYDALVAPLYRSVPMSARPWAVVAMDTIRPHAHSGVYTCDTASVALFLENPGVSRAQKHQLVAMYATKAMLFSTAPANVQAVARAWTRFYLCIEGLLRLALLSLFETHRRPLALLAEIEPGAGEAQRLERLALIGTTVAELIQPHELLDLVSAIARACADVAPHMTLLCWQYKSSLRTGGMHNTLDLTSTMRAHVQLRAYDRALAVYAAHTQLQDELQIALLLRTCERSKDWKLLQQQFEAMYGRGNLPYVVHYAVVMGALASIGAVTEVEQLYAQLLRRKLAPTAPIFAALVMCNINNTDYPAAEKWYSEFMAVVERGVIDAEHVPGIQLRMLEARLPLMTVGAAIAELQQLAERQHENTMPLIDTATIRAVLRHGSSMYSLSGFEAVWSIAENLALLDDTVYADALAFLTKMGQFARADELAYIAHLESPVPFQNSLILAGQLRNYGQWRKETTDPKTYLMLSERALRIIATVDANDASPKHLDVFLVEIIKYFIGMGKLSVARSYLNLANAANISSERHFVPFLQEFSAKRSYDDNSDVLNLYQEMVSRKLSITARTYYYLSRSLLVIDSANKKGHTNSFNLLQSVLEMYGFSILQETGTSKASVAQLSQNAIHLLRLVSDYAIEASAHDEETMNLLLNFLKQMREKLDKHIDYSFRVSILTEMSKVYRVFGDLDVANSLVDNALKEMNDVIVQLPKDNPLPKLLQLDYRRNIDIKIGILNQRDAPVHEYAALLEHVLAQNVRLSTYQLHSLSQKLLSAPSNLKKNVSLILNSCERYLVAGNWAEIKINRKIHYIYRMFLIYLGRTMSPEAISNKYALFNQVYDIQDVAELLRENRGLHSPRAQLEIALKDYLTLCPRETWTFDLLFENLAEFFTPERTFASRNFIRPNLASSLVTAIEQICGGENTVAFEFYDEYPETMEYLLFFVGERTRVVAFRAGINKLHGQSDAAQVDGRAARRQHSVDILQHLWSQ